MVTIYPLAKIIDGDNIKFGDPVIIDDFVFIGHHKTAEIGSYVHIASFSSLTGGGDLRIGDFVTMSSGVRIFTGSDNPYGLHGSTIPEEYRDVKRTHCIIFPHAFIGANSVVLPEVMIGPGAIVAAGSVVRHNLEGWWMYAGNPLRRIKKVDKDRVMEEKERLLEGV